MNRVSPLRKVDHQDPTPKYLQAQEILVDAIRTGQYAPGAKLPSTKAIGGLINISLITAHKALEGLVESGWLRREVGRGTYVRDDVDPAHEGLRQACIGLLFDHRHHVDTDDYYHGALINGLRRAARAENRRVEFFLHDQFDLREKARRDVGAICIHPPLDAQAEVERLAQRHPVVVLGGTFPGSRVSCVDCDNVGGAQQAVRHLLQLGHREFLIVGGPMILSNSRDRAAGAAAELADHGIRLQPRDQLVCRDGLGLDRESRVRLVQRLSAPDRPTAVVAGGFHLAMEVMQAARQARLVIPGNLSVVGFDDPPSAPLLDPPLTTLRQPLTEMAARAYHLVYQAIMHRSIEPSWHRLPVELFVRRSTGPAPRPQPR